MSMKTFGLIAFAAMAIAAIGGPAAASAASFTASAVNAELQETTIEDHVFTVTGSQLQCDEVNLSGQTEGTASGGLGFTTQSQNLTPEADECEAFGFPAMVKNEGCTIDVTVDGDMVIHAEFSHCTTIIIISNFFATCEVVIGSQEVPGALSYSNASNGDIDISINASGIDAEVKKSTGLCPLTQGSHTNATYVGKSRFSASGANLAFDA